MDDFTAARDQDAWGTIRGFKYQVDQTLLRWLALGPDQQLELECGEDIDLVAKALSESGEAAYYRKLEQVKVREQRLSLRSGIALEALANAHAQRVANPDIDLRFCFTTNAGIGSEKPNPFPSKVRGIELWQQLANGSLSNGATDSALQSLQSFLPSANKPRKIKASRWREFVTFIQDSDACVILDFVRRFEWSCGGLEAEDLATEVHRQIRQVAKITDDIQSKELYDRLFLAVLVLLSRPGGKRLTARMLAEQVAMPTLSATDHQLLQMVKVRVSALELRMEQVAEAVDSLSSKIHSLAEHYGGQFTALDLVGSVSIEAPPAIVRLSQRTDTVGDLVERTKAKTWLALYGASETGKTHLAALIAEASPRSSWIKFQSSAPPEQAAAVLHASLRMIAPHFVGQPSAASYETICLALSHEGVIVLDDLPQHDGTSVLAERLAWLARGCQRAGAKVISTSYHRLPTRLVETLPTDSVLEIPTPPFNDSEVRDVLSAHGAPQTFLSNATVRLINGLSSGNSLLVTLSARYLSSKNWELGDAELDSLLQGDHTAGIADEVLVRIGSSLDTAQRDFLYRLALSVTAIEDTVAVQLAEVPPSISKPQECLATLMGAWVQRPAERMVTVSPVARSVAHGNLDKTTKRLCHRTLGTGITSQVMDPWDAQIAIGHFVSAEEFDLAGSLFLSLLEELRRRPYVSAYKSLLAMWAETSLPDRMHIGIRLLIRALQFWVFPRYGRSDSFALSELDSLMSVAGPSEAHIAYHVAALAGLFLSERDFIRAICYYTQAIRLLRLSKVNRRDLIIPRGKQPVETLWTFITNVCNVNDLEPWKSAFDQLTGDEQQVVIQSKDARLGCVVFSDRLMLLEADKPATDRNWNTVLGAVRGLQQWAEERKWGHLHAAALQSEINLRGEYLNDVVIGKAEVESFLERDDRSDEDKGLVSGMYGKMLAGANRHAEALPWLERALKHPPSVKGHNWLMTLAASIRCSTDLKRRRQLSEDAANIARASRSISPIERAKTLGELTVADLAGEATQEAALRVYTAWSELAEVILSDHVRDNEWKSLFVMFGHVQGFLLPLARGGTPPQTASDGSPYAAPYQGMFYTSHPERADLFQPESVAGIMWFHSLYARTANDEESADRWLNRAKEEIDSLPETYLTTFIQQDFIPVLLNADDFEGALDRGCRGIEASIAIKEAYDRQGRDKQAIPYDTPLAGLVENMSEAGVKLIDQFSVTQVTFPALLRIARLALTDRDNATEFARQMEVLCRARGQRANLKENWLDASQVFDAVSRNATVDELRILAHSFDATEKQALRILGYFAVAIADTPSDAFAAQLASMEVVFAWHPTDTTIHRQLLLPFIEDYWVDAFQRQRFRFRSPGSIDKALDDALQSDPQARVKAILRAVRPGFKVAGLSDAERWLQNKP